MTTDRITALAGRREQFRALQDDPVAASEVVQLLDEALEALASSHAFVERLEKDEFRILCRKPGKRKWQFLPFTGATARSHEEAARSIERQHETAPPGPRWSFKVQRRVTVIQHTEWEDA